MNSCLASCLDGFVGIGPHDVCGSVPELLVPALELPVGRGHHALTFPRIYLLSPFLASVSFSSYVFCSMSDRRVNPSRSARPRPQSLGDGEEDRARGTHARRTTNPPSSRAPASADEGPRSCPDRSTLPCPPPLHRTVVRDSVAPGQIEVEGRAINPEVVRNLRCVLDSSP